MNSTHACPFKGISCDQFRESTTIIFFLFWRERAVVLLVHCIHVSIYSLCCFHLPFISEQSVFSSRKSSVLAISHMEMKKSVAYRHKLSGSHSESSSCNSLSCLSLWLIHVSLASGSHILIALSLKPYLKELAEFVKCVYEICIASGSLTNVNMISV